MFVELDSDLEVRNLYNLHCFLVLKNQHTRSLKNELTVDTDAPSPHALGHFD